MANNIIGERIKYLRREMGLTQKELAHEAGMSVDAVRRCETGPDSAVRCDYIHMLARVLSVKPSYLSDPHDYTMGTVMYQFQFCPDPDGSSVITVQFPRALDSDEIVRLTALLNTGYDPASCPMRADKIALLRTVLDKFCDSTGIPEWRAVPDPIFGRFVLGAQPGKKTEKE